MKEGQLNDSKIVSMAEWKNQALAKIQDKSVQVETPFISKEELIALVQEYISKLEFLLSEMRKGVAQVKDNQQKMEKDADQKIVWNEEVLDWNEKQESRVKELDEYIARGKFLLTRKDIESDELKKYFQLDIKSLWPEEARL